MWNQKRLQIVEAILSKKNIGETALPDFKIHNCSKKNSMVLKRNRHVDQLDKIEDLNKSTCNYDLIFEKGKYNGEKTASSKMVLEKLCS